MFYFTCNQRSMPNIRRRHAVYILYAEQMMWRIMKVFVVWVNKIVKPKFHYADFLETSPWHVSRGRFEEVGDLSRGSRGHGSWNGEDTGKFWGFKPSRYVEMVWKNPVRSRRQTRLRRSNGIWKRARRHDKRTFARRCTPGRAATDHVLAMTSSFTFFVYVHIR